MGMWDKVKTMAGNAVDHVNIAANEWSVISTERAMHTASKGTPQHDQLQKQIEIAKKNVERSKSAIKHRNAMYADLEKEAAALESNTPSMEGDIADGIDEALGLKDPEPQVEQNMSMEAEIASGLEDALGVSEQELSDMETEMQAEMNEFEPVAAERERPEDIQNIVDNMDKRIQEREGITLEEKVSKEREALRQAQERGEPAPASILDELGNKEQEDLSPEDKFKMSLEEEFSSLEADNVQRVYSNKVRQSIAEGEMVKQGHTDGIESPEVDSMEKVGIATQVLSEKMGLDMPELPDEGLTPENVQSYADAFSDKLSAQERESGVSLQMEVSKEQEGHVL